jgi:hypothetical protein
VRAEKTDKGYCSLPCGDDNACLGQDPQRSAFCNFFDGTPLRFCAYICQPPCPASMRCQDNLCLVK